MKLTILGSCSGTEPMPGRHHTAFTVEHGGRLFWFDAGETCSHTAHVAGLDLPATEAIFISHPHLDHTGGLPNLIWTLCKLASRYPEARSRLADRTIGLYLPDPAMFDGVLHMLRTCEHNFRMPFTLEPRPCANGVIHDAHGLRVTALANAHLGPATPPRSFSFRMEAGGRAAVYSGDVTGVADFAPLIVPCRLLLMETGHHRPEEVCRQLHPLQKEIGELLLVHHGRAVLRDPAGELARARAAFGANVRVADDGMAIDLGSDA